MLVWGIAVWLVLALFLIENPKEEHILLVDANLFSRLIQTACRERE